MDCTSAQAAISSLLDGEDPGVARRELEDHLAGCPACRAWQGGAHQLTRLTRLQPLDPALTTPDPLLERIGTVFGDEPGRDARRMLELALLVIGILQLAAVAAIVRRGASDDVWDLLSVQVALGVGFLVCARRPQRAHALVLVVGTAAVLMMTAAVVDITRGRTDVLAESPHVITLVGWVLLWRLARRTPPGLDDARLHWPVHLTPVWRRHRRGAEAGAAPAASPWVGDAAGGASGLRRSGGLSDAELRPAARASQWARPGARGGGAGIAGDPGDDDRLSQAQ